MPVPVLRLPGIMNSRSTAVIFSLWLAGSITRAHKFIRQNITPIFTNAAGHNTPAIVVHISYILTNF
jgi:hypothetical protein